MPSLFLHLAVAGLIVILGLDQRRALVRRGVSPVLQIVPILLALIAAAGEIALATGQPIGAAGIVIWLGFFAFGTRGVDFFGLSAPRWRVLQGLRRLQTLQERVTALRSEAEAILNEMDRPASPGGDQPLFPRVGHRAPAASAYVRLGDQERRARVQMGATLARLSAARDSSTGPLVDLLDEAYGHAVRLDAPTPERAEYLRLEIPKRAAELFRDLGHPA